MVWMSAAAVAAVLATGGGAAAGTPAWPGGTVVGMEPVWLAPGVVTTEVLTRDLAVMPAGDEIYFTMASAGYAHAVICVTRRTPDGWTAPAVAPFSGDPRWLDLEPFIAPDGGRLYFMSTRNDDSDGADDPDLWFVPREGDGWGRPRPVGPPVNTAGQESFPAVTADGTLYFTRADSTGRVYGIWRARPDGAGGFAEPRRLPPQVNAGSNRFNAWVAPDESRLILSIVGLEGAHGAADYWQVERRPDGTWGQAANLGARVNAGRGRGSSQALVPDGTVLAYLAVPTTDDPWPRTWGQLQGRARMAGAAGGIAVVAWADLDRPGTGPQTLAPTATPLPFPTARGPWLGQTLPGSEPELFAPGLLSTGLGERDVLVLPGQEEVWYGLMDRGLVTILATRLVDGVWTEPVTVPFCDDPDFACFEPALSADGSRVFFLANRAAPGQVQGSGWTNQNIFTARRTAGGWSVPAALPPPITSDAAEYFPSLAADGTLYFTREDAAGAAVWCAEPDGEGFAVPVRLTAAVNLTAQVYNATVAPDESWLIACVVDHPDNLGGADYWISFRRPDGAWLPAVNLGEPFNGPGEQAASASLSPDGSVLFFSSRRTVGELFPGGVVTPARLRELQGRPG
ncbi:MAG: PD40 domain-containing protein [Rhodospirillales bacterium]|nr:PD40 domain-containing protein [Rhodospirillales bacterium]